MKTRALFDRILAMWPPELDLSEPATAPGSGWWFPRLARINADDLEAKIDCTTDHWGSVGATAFYQAVTRHANDMYASGHRTMATSSMPLALFDEIVRDKLQADGWELEAAAYERENGGSHAV